MTEIDWLGKENQPRVTIFSSFTSRPYETEQDLLKMQAQLMDARSRTDDWHYAHVGELQFNFFMALCHLDPRRHIRLWHDAAGRLAAYAMLGEDPAFDFQVLPEYEWTGIEAEALKWADERLVELRRQGEKLWGGSLVSGSRQDNLQRMSFLEQNGFRQGGQFSEVNMLHRLDDSILEVDLPPGCVVREVTESDIPDRAAAHREVWHPWTVGNITDEDYASFMRLPGYHRDLDVVTVAPDGVIAAYVNGWIDPQNGIGDFGPVGARPAYRRQGLTRAALVEGLRRMRAYGMDRVCISTGVSNTPALRLYESIGFRVVNRYLEYVRVE
jgi:ribosomal protein S18 acetylase RimI-like enzyme